MNRNNPADRFYFEPAYSTPVCNCCVHSHGLRCDAFPERIPISVLALKVEQRDNPNALRESCNGQDDIHFEAKPE